jgi:hypothetical protein
MWQVENATPFAAQRNWVRDRNGAEVWIVSVKGTYGINADGSVDLLNDQEEVRFAPVFRGDPAKSSLLYDSDLMPSKSAVDVILNATAYAPVGSPARQVEVSVSIGDWRKDLWVSGDRTWEYGFWGVAAGRPMPFTTMPISYERAFGGVQTDQDGRVRGWEQRNPVGTGFAIDEQGAHGQALPNVEFGNERISSWRDRPAPAGFGAIAAHWTPRRELAGTFGEEWKTERQPLVPDDFDDGFYQCAPKDQQIEGLRGDEVVTLTNLTPEGYLQFRLPRVAFGFRTRFGKKSVDHSSRLQTVVIEPDLPRMMLVWQASLSCHTDVLALDCTRITQKRVAAW